MKKFLIWVSLAVFLFVGVYAAADMAKLEPTYDGRNATVSVYDLIQDPDSYDDSVADGAAAAIVQQDLAKTHAVNDVTSIVFDFRGYDTMGEAFILISAVAGVTILLRRSKLEKKEALENDKH